MELADRINTQPLQTCVLVAQPTGATMAATSVSPAEGLMVEVLPLSAPGLDAGARYAVRLRDLAGGKSVTLEGLPDPASHRLGRVRVWVRSDPGAPSSSQIAWENTADVPAGPPLDARAWARQLDLWRPLQGVRPQQTMLDLAGGLLADWQGRGDS